MTTTAGLHLPSALPGVTGDLLGRKPPPRVERRLRLPASAPAAASESCVIPYSCMTRTGQDDISAFDCRTDVCAQPAYETAMHECHQEIPSDSCLAQVITTELSKISCVVSSMHLLCIRLQGVAPRLWASAICPPLHFGETLITGRPAHALQCCKTSQYPYCTLLLQQRQLDQTGDRACKGKGSQTCCVLALQKFQCSTAQIVDWAGRLHCLIGQAVGPDTAGACVN